MPGAGQGGAGQGRVPGWQWLRAYRGHEPLEQRECAGGQQVAEQRAGVKEEQAGGVLEDGLLGVEEADVRVEGLGGEGQREGRE